MQNPVGAEFNFETMRMELTSFPALLFNPVPQVKRGPVRGNKLRLWPADKKRYDGEGPPANLRQQ
jgi:hypothetical protein